MVAVVLGGLAGACFMDSDGADGDEGGTGTSAATTVAPASTTNGGTSTGSDPTATSSDATSSASTDDSSTGDSSGGDVGCWDKDPTQWDVETLDVSAVHGDSPRAMAISGDGLSLVYQATEGALPGVFIAERSGLGEEFSGGVLVADWAADATLFTEVRFAGPGFLALKDDDVVSTSRLSGGLWWAPEAVAFDEPPTVLTGGPRFFDDLRGMMIDIADGPNGTLIAYETRRVNTDQPFGGFTRINMPRWSSDTPLLCPVPSPDGEHVFFGGAFPATWSSPADELNSALDVWYAPRNASGAWDEPIEIDVVSNEAVETCPGSITDDGCTMILLHFELGAGPVGWGVATR